MSVVLSEIRGALRRLLGHRAVSAFSILTLALGIGSVVAVWSVVQAVLIRPLPYGEPERLALVYHRTPESNDGRFSTPDLADYREADSLAALGAFYYRSARVSLADRTLGMWAGTADHGTFAALMPEPLLGRVFTEEDFQGADRDRVILSHGLWVSELGADPEIVGQSLQVNGSAHRVIGVLPAEFVYPVEFQLSERVPLWLQQQPNRDTLPRDRRFAQAVARLRPGVSLEDARLELETICRRLRTEFPNDYPPTGEFSIRLVPVEESVLGAVRTPLEVLFAAVVCVLLIACINVAHLLLIATESRQRELAVRTALGAGRGRLVGQLALESLLIALGGGILGITGAAAMMRFLIALAPANVPRLDETSIDAWVTAFALLVTAISAAVCVAVTARSVIRHDPAAALRASGTGAGDRRLPRRRLLIFVEVAVTFVLLTAAVLFGRSLYRLLQVDIGYGAQPVLAADLSLSEDSYPSIPKVLAFQARLKNLLLAVPGVRYVAYSSAVPVWGPATTTSALPTRLEHVSETDAGVDVPLNLVTPDIFRTMGISVIEGRGFTAADRHDTVPVAVVNRALQRRYWGDDNVIGRRLRPLIREECRWMEVVGVVGNVRDVTPQQPPAPQIYLPLNQGEGCVPERVPRTMALLVRTTSDPESLLPDLRRALRETDKGVALGLARGLGEHVAESIAAQRFAAIVLALLAAAALLLALLGVSGVLAHATFLRLPEFGIRAALGASPLEMASLVLGEAMAVAGTGVAVGAVAAFNLRRWVESFLYDIAPGDPWSFLASGLGLLLATFAAAGIPAWRAAHVDPTQSLRSE